MKKLFALILFITIMLTVVSCSTPDNPSEHETEDTSTKIDVVISNPEETTGNTEATTSPTTGDETSGNTETSTPPATESDGNGSTIDVQIGITVLTATLADNSSAKAFEELLKSGDITVDMHDYGNFEKVGPLPQSIVRNDENITTEPGDIILYQGNQITIYYDTNSWNFTRLGKIDGASKEKLESLLGDGNVSVTFRLHKEETPTTKVLVAYFSATGTTKKVAEYAAEALGADIYEIVPAIPYSSADLNYNNSDCRANTEMNDPSCRPAINGGVADMDGYDIIFIGYPIWWGEAPRIVSTFVESYNFSGKTVVTFCTSGGSGHNDSSIKKLVTGADWITGKRLNSNSSKSDVAEWIGGLGLDITVK